MALTVKCPADARPMEPTLLKQHALTATMVMAPVLVTVLPPGNEDCRVATKV